MKSANACTGIVFFISALFVSASNAQVWHSGFSNCICLPAYIVAQPVSPAPVCPNSSVITFSVVAGGTGPLTYKWKENGVFLSDSGIYSGTNSSTLTLLNPGSSLNGKIFQCQVYNCSRSFALTDQNAVLLIQSNVTDVNEDGVTDNEDFSRLNLLYNSSCANCREDINADGFIDVKDFLQMLGVFNTSCQ